MLKTFHNVLSKYNNNVCYNNKYSQKFHHLQLDEKVNLQLSMKKKNNKKYYMDFLKTI